MVIQEGYKQTEIGVIPKDWEVMKLGDLGKFTKGQGIRKDDAQSGEIPCVRYGELYTRHNDYIKQFYSFISKEISLTSKKLKRGDILFAGSGETKEEIGKCVAFLNGLEAYAGGDIVILSPRNQSSLFLGFLLNSPFIQKQKASKGQGDAVVHISANQLQNISIPLPPLTEQTAIATALSDADALITILEKLIAKKRLIKQGAMQQLLQPKDGWEVKMLGEIAGIRDGTHQTPKYVKSGVPFYSVESVTNNNFTNTKFISKEEHDFLTKTFRMERGDILMTRIGSIGDCKLIDWDVDASFYVSLALLKIKQDFSAKYIYHYSKSSNFKFEAELNSLHYAIPKKINLGPISNIKIELPPLNEQIRIATILSDMDAELSALEQKLSKYKKVKLGMMQELLTGKTRLM